MLQTPKSTLEGISCNLPLLSDYFGKTDIQLGGLLSIYEQVPGSQWHKSRCMFKNKSALWMMYWLMLNMLSLRFKAKCKILHLDQGDPKHKDWLGKELLKATVGKRIWECWIKSSIWPSNVTCSPRRQRHPELHQKQHGQQFLRGSFIPLLQSWDPT